MRNTYNEMKRAGISHTDMLWELAGAVSLFALPVCMLLVGAAYGY